MIRPLMFFVVLYSAVYLFGRVASVYFYAEEFQDFVNDQVKFAPFRQNTDEVRLSEQIRDAARYYNLRIDRPGDIKIHKTQTIPGMTWTTLGVDVRYTALVDLSLFKQPVHFHTAASVAY